MRNNTTWVVVLGDFGRSPRMQYHAISLSEQVVSLTQHKLFVKAAVQILLLCYCMFIKLPRPDTVLVQNPPAIPALALCVLVCWWHGAKLVIDWHNFGYTIMSLTMGRRHPLVLFARRYEWFFGRQATSHLCVSKAMQLFLQAEWGITATVFYDTPPPWFHKADLHEQHELCTRIAADLNAPMHDNDPAYQVRSPYSQHHFDTVQDKSRHAEAKGLLRTDFNVFTHAVEGKPQLKPLRPALLVSSTSWTMDEDFGILLQAALQYEQMAASSNGSLPGLMIAVTGKGPQKAMYEEKMQQMRLHHVAFRTLWLEASDYPLLLGSADLGVCLHTSSSGLDLPMKVVDMFGCGLPVCAASYDCIDELVKEGQTGLLFDSYQQLADQWVALFQGFPGNPSKQLLHMQHQVQQRKDNWSASWEKLIHIFA
ncbi:MAG: glycosyltransferase domain-containing protein [Trebouxia sp. A1-2]|nr:MAG: glycosyltransferase domain-containing protein [Trebouxia sp. A1-2]